MPFLQRHVFVCTNQRPPDNPKGSCANCGGVAVRDALKAKLAEKGLNKVVRANSAGCLDQCDVGVAVVVYPEQVWYGRVTEGDLDEIIESHLIGGNPVTRLLLPNQDHLVGNVLPTVTPTSSLVSIGKKGSKS